jgi:hypothetical protein
MRRYETPIPAELETIPGPCSQLSYRSLRPLISDILPIHNPHLAFCERQLSLYLAGFTARSVTYVAKLELYM